MNSFEDIVISSLCYPNIRTISGVSLSSRRKGKTRISSIAIRYCLPLGRKELKERYVPRPELERELMSAIARAQGENRIVLLYGIGGSGKTTLVNKVLTDLEKNGYNGIKAITATINIVPEEYRPSPTKKLYFAVEEEALIWLVIKIYEELGIKRDTKELLLGIARILINLVSVGAIAGSEPLKSIVEVIERAEEPLELFNKIRSSWGTIKEALVSPRMPRTAYGIINRDLVNRLKKLKKEWGVDWIVISIDDLSDVEPAYREGFLRVIRALAGDIPGLTFVAVYGYLGISEEEVREKEVEAREMADGVGAIPVHVPPVSKGELNTLKELVESMGFKLKDNERKVLEVLWRKTQGAPRRVCIVLQMIEMNTKSREVGLESLKEIPDYWRDQIHPYVVRAFHEFKKALYTASCMLNFTRDELVQILVNEGLSHQDAKDQVLQFLKSGLVRKWVVLKEEQIYSFCYDSLWLKDCIYELVLSDEEKRSIHEKILEYFKSGKKSARKYGMTVYYAEELLKLVSNEEKREELAELIVERSMDLARYAYYEGIPFATVYYGLKVYNYAKELKMWIKALEAAGRILCYASAIQLSKEKAKSIKNELRGIFDKAREVNEEDARCWYVVALGRWAFYALNTLNDSEEIESVVNEGLKVIGGRDSRLISDELKWYGAYSLLPAIQAEIAMRRGDYDNAVRILEERKELLDKYKDRIIERWGERAYYYDLATIENRLCELTLMMAYSKDKLKESLEHCRNSLKNFLKTGRTVDAVRARVNLAKIMMLLAKSPDDFEKAISEEIEGYDLNKYIDKFKEAGDREGEAIAKSLMSISLLANRRDNEAVKLAVEALEIAKESPDEGARTFCELTLAYILMVSNLDEFRRNTNIAKLIFGLTSLAHIRFDKLRAINVFISFAILRIELYLLGDLDFDELLKELGELISILEEKRGNYRAWVLRGVREAIEREGLNEEVLRTAIIKLLVAL